jgi:hypothetical protein
MELRANLLAAYASAGRAAELLERDIPVSLLLLSHRSSRWRCCRLLRTLELNLTRLAST